MPNKIDLTGQVFGRLTVLEDIGRSGGGVLWRCLCECGNRVEVKSYSLQSGHTKSCGCYAKEQTSEAHKKDLIGQIFGRLTVLENVGRTKDRKVIWKCQCDCGNTIDVIGNSLQSGNTKSCGCYHKERVSETHLGEKSHNWKGGITSLSQAIRNSTFYKRWRTSIFQRDNFICTHCGIRGGKLHAHHIKFFSVILDEYNITTLEEAEACEALWNISNGITLCQKGHKKLHSSEGLDIE
jgi:hypothetical protein